ncbi:alpha/beta hydrolase [Kaistia nematophila]|uniref:Alpha/beta hydrolase n=1 Tax=Kaistia nematophila TaxID=2994654 RepID=A0A9X3E110_9HYPH|nr:alpha/beta hydrolase [Kaistia nematophila]MCX5569771.1 alpha/beta hydrolase [Kaistia nematophila]
MTIDKTRGAAPHAGQRILSAGAPVEKARAAVVMLHGRGATADDIIGLADHLGQDDVAYFAPQAAGYAWYPQRFMQPTALNQPYLGAALDVVHNLVEDIVAAGIARERIVLLGFSQGACLALEAVARKPGRYGGAVGLSGGLIGADNEVWNGADDLAGTPVLLGCAELDAHIPLSRVQETAARFEKAGAGVTTRIYRGSAHGVNADEIELTTALLSGIGKTAAV